MHDFFGHVRNCLYIRRVQVYIYNIYIYIIYIYTYIYIYIIYIYVHILCIFSSYSKCTYPGASIATLIVATFFLLVTRSTQKKRALTESARGIRANAICYLRFVAFFEFALVCAFCADLRSFCTFCCTCLRPFWRQLDHVEEENTAEWDFCPNRQKALGIEWEAKSAIEQGGRQKFMLRWRFQDVFVCISVDCPYPQGSAW